MASVWKLVVLSFQQYRAIVKFRGLDATERESSNLPNQLVQDILSLGPTFIKLGQVLSTRPDLLPSQYIRALEPLQEEVPPFASAIARQIVEHELNCSLDEIFSAFDERPIASASLSQVHFAVLKSGEEVAVKIRRPGVGEKVRSELRLLGRILSAVSLFRPKLIHNLNLHNLFQEFRRYTLQEIDFSNEGSVYVRFVRNFRNDKKVIFPSVFLKYTTPSVLTMERVSGLRLHQVRDSMSLDDRAKLTNTVIEMLINMFIRDGFFHADLHPGNIFFGKDGSVKIIDVGMYGELTEVQRERFILYWLAVVLKEKTRAYHHLLQLLQSTAEADETGFRNFYENLLDEFYSSTIQENSLTQTYLKIIFTSARYGFIPPPEILLQAKALTTMENLAFVLVPGFRFAEATKPFITRAYMERYSVGNVIRRINQSFPELFLLGEAVHSTLYGSGNDDNYLWQETTGELARRLESYHSGNYHEHKHGEYAVEINASAEVVFNFVSRLARYPLWHPIYTPESHVIHVSGEWIFLTPDVLGSVFRLDEIVDGYHALSNGIVIEFERNHLMKWVSPFFMFPAVSMGTCFHVDVAGEGKTRLSEYFYFSENPMHGIWTNQKWFTKESLTQHIHEELTGVKNILEFGSFSESDVTYLWEELRLPVRIVDGKKYEITHVNGGPSSRLID